MPKEPGGSIKTRSIEDLFVAGRCVTIEDGRVYVDADGGEEPAGPALFWMQRVGAADEQNAVRKAQAAKARVLMAKNDRAGEEYLAQVSEALRLYRSRDQQIMFVVAHELNERRAVITARVAAGEPWGKDNYLQGLHDAWTLGLKAMWEDGDADDPDSDASRCWAELQRYQAEVDTLVAAESPGLRAPYEAMPDGDLLEKATDRHLDSAANTAWFLEYELAVTAASVRIPCRLCAPDRGDHPGDHSRRYFTSGIDGLKACRPEAQSILKSIYMQLEVDAAEGKGLRATPSSSQPSGSPGEEGTSESSGQEEPELSTTSPSP